MKKLLLASIAACALFLTGCASTMPYGALYTNVELPVTATGNSGSAAKVGQASCTSILMLIAIGDCSISAAMAEGNITEVHSVDWKAVNILGIIGNYTVIVRGK